MHSADAKLLHARSGEVRVRCGGGSMRPRSTMFELHGIDHVALLVRDLEQSARWYIDVLGFEHRYPGMWNGVPIFVGKGTTALAVRRGRRTGARTSIS